MPDLEHLTIDGTKYDISDADSREDITELKNDLSDFKGDFEAKVSGDCDDLDFGIYLCNNCSNTPTTSQWWAVISYPKNANGTTSFQVAIGILNAVKGDTYYRRKASSVWEEWELLIDPSAITTINNTLSSLQTSVNTNTTNITTNTNNISTLQSDTADITTAEIEALF